VPHAEVSVPAPVRAEPGEGLLRGVSSYGPGQSSPGAGSTSRVCCPAPGCTG